MSNFTISDADLRSIIHIDSETKSKQNPQYIGTCPWCGKEKHFYINKHTQLFDCKKCGVNGSIYKFGETENTVDIWWPFLLEEVGGFHFVVQSEEDEDIPVYPLANPYQPNPWNPDDDDFFSEYEDYNWTHMNHAGGRYQF